MTLIRITQRIIFLILFLLICEQLRVNAMEMTKIVVPKVVDVKDIIKLSCSYNMGKHKLNSVKWYKNEMEFFRYSPMSHPPIMLFPVAGVNLPSIVNKTYSCNRVTCTVTLDKLKPNSSGAYRCEVSGDAPEFKLISKTANMIVAAMPRLDPIISGVAQNYMEDDFVIANCTSDLSSPTANLVWFINDELAPIEFLQPQHETSVDIDGFQLRYRTLQIRFYANEIRTNARGALKLRCVSTIPQIPTATRDTTSTIYITSTNVLKNQKLINWLASGAGFYNSKKIIVIIFFNYLLTKGVYEIT